MLKFIIHVVDLLSDYKPKHIVFDKDKFVEERVNLGGLAQVGMNTTGGTDID